MHAGVERQQFADGDLWPLPVRHRCAALHRRRRRPVAGWLERRSGWHRDRRLVQRSATDRRRLRERHHHLQRFASGHGRRGKVADQLRRHRPPEQGDQAGGGLGRGACRPLQISYTIPTSASGLESSGVAMLQNAIANGARIDVVNIMAFDYYDHVTTHMGGGSRERGHRHRRAAASAVSRQRQRRSCGRWSVSRSCPASTTTRRRRK